MAIPLGTTARQVAAVGRWSLGAMTVLVMVAGWWPTYEGWVALGAGLGGLWVIWLLWKILRNDSTVRGQPMGVILLVPAMILTYHVIATDIIPSPEGRGAMSGELNSSMIYQLALLGLGMVLANSFLGPTSSSPATAGVVGAALVAAAAAELAFAPSPDVHGATATLGLAGAAAWASICGSGVRPAVRVAAGVGAAVAAGALAVVAPREALLAVAVAGLCPLLAGRALLRRRAAWIAVAIGAAAMTLTSILSLPELLRQIAEAPHAAIGAGESALARLSAADSGLVVLVGVIGWAGAAWLVAAFVACAAFMNLHSPRPSWRGLAWSAAAGICAASLLLPGGLFTPAVTLGVAVCWGLLPATTGRPIRSRPGILLAAFVIPMLLLLGLVNRVGLPLWSVQTFQLGDSFLHATTGFLLSLMLAWLLGRRRIWHGLLAIVAGALTGGLGEAAQGLLSHRGMEMKDWCWHAVGSAVALAPYLLAMAARWAESPLARPIPRTYGTAAPSPQPRPAKTPENR